MKNFYIEEKKDGGVRYRMSYKDPLTGKTKRVTVSYDHDSVRNRRKAEEELSKKVESILKGVDRSNLTFKQVVEDYIAYNEKALKMTTARRNGATIRRILSTFPEDTLLNNVTTIIWKEHLLSLSKNKPGTYNEYVTRLKTFLKWCLQNEYLNDYNVIMKLPKLKDVSKREKVADKYLEENEATALVRSMEGMTQWQLLTEFLILSGLRIGESFALLWSDIDDTDIHVTKTLDFKTETVTSTKTLTSTRDVSIQDELMDCIKRIKEYDEWRRNLGVNSELVFPGAAGGYAQYHSYNKYLREKSEKVLSRHVTAHTLRHTHVSLMFAQGVSLEAISRRVGHNGSKITREIYLHLTEKVKEKDAKAIKPVKLL